MSFARYSPHGHPVSDGAGGLAPHDVATVAALKALASDHFGRVHGNVVTVRADGSRWKFHETSTLTGDDILVITPTNGSGRWLREEGSVDLAIAFDYSKADAATLLTLQTGQRMTIENMYWRVTTSFSGGSSSAIGVSSTKTGFTTKGDLLGGASGDVAATLVSTGVQGVVSGTIGPKLDTVAELKAAIFLAADDFRFDRITSAFTAGVGEVHIVGKLLANPGA